jgi:hypothetical protein
MVKYSGHIRSIVTAEIATPEINNALFIIDFNNFKEDLIKATKLLDGIQAEENKICLAFRNSEEALNAINSKELIHRMGFFYGWARDYDDNFGIRNWLPKSNGRPFRFNIWFPEMPFCYEEEASNAENAYKAHGIFVYYDEYFRNFINTLYGDGEEGIEFFDRKFSEVIDEYNFLKQSSEEVKRYMQPDEISISSRKIESNKEDISSILKKYPATVYAAVIEIIKFHETAGSE